MQSIKDETLILIDNELTAAKKKFPKDFNSTHEGYAVLLEEVDELWADIKNNCSRPAIQKEAVQVAAMAIRIIQELTDIDDAADYAINRENLQRTNRDYETKVCQAVLKTFEIEEAQLRSSKKDATFVMARVVYAALLTKKGFTRSKIGDYLNRDHSTVVYTLNSHNDWMQMRGEYKGLYLKTELQLLEQ